MSSLEWIKVGTITSPHGVRGLVKVQPYLSSENYHLLNGPLYDHKGTLILEGEVRTHAAERLIMAFAQIRTREEAMQWAKTSLYIEKGKLPAPSDEEYYFSDLIGCTALLRDGTVYGIVTGVDNYGASDIVEITYPSGIKGLYPFVEEVVQEVDIANRRLIILPPEVL